MTVLSSLCLLILFAAAMLKCQWLRQDLEAARAELVEARRAHRTDLETALEDLRKPVKKLWDDESLALDQIEQNKRTLADQGLVCTYWWEEDEKLYREEEAIKMARSLNVVTFRES